MSIAFRCFTLAALAVALLPAQTPSALTVRSATSRRVDLAFTSTAATFVLERKPLNGSFATLQNLTATTAADTAIDPMETYVYRVRAVTPSGLTDPSNEVTVGPPPAGVRNIVPLPANMTNVDNYSPSGFGLWADLKLDTNGDPALLYFVSDPNVTSTPAEGELRFRNWNRAAYQWNPEIKIATVGDLSALYHLPFSLAVDAANGAYAVATEDATNGTILILTSSDGKDWRQVHTITRVDDLPVASPSLALAAGTLHLSYNRDYDGTRYLTGRYADSPTSWRDALIPRPGGVDRDSMNVSTALALDTKAVPAIAFFTASGDYNRILTFWRPAMPSAIRIADTQNIQSDFVDVRMVFQGDNPRILFEANRDSSLYYEVTWVVRSDNGGATWTNPVYIPRDGGHHSINPPFDIAITPSGQGAVAFTSSGGQGDDTCPGIKLSRSSDLSNWTTCAFTSGTPDAEYSNGGSLRIQYAVNGRLYILWQQTTPSPAGLGLLLWRE